MEFIAASFFLGLAFWVFGTIVGVCWGIEHERNKSGYAKKRNAPTEDQGTQTTNFIKTDVA